MRLHTDLAAFKAAIRGEAPMTPLSAAALELIDPAFANGLGSLQEDPQLGLRCPLRACGDYFQDLGRHVRSAHASLLTVDRFRVLLELPSTAPLVASGRLDAARRRARGRPASEMRLVHPTAAAVRRAAKRRGVDQATMGARNLADRCHAQLEKRLGTLRETLGHTPTFAEATLAWGAGLVSFIVRHYGNWNEFKDSCSVETLHRGGQERVGLEAVLDQLKAWLGQHEDLPTYDECAAADRPALAHPETVLRALSSASWETAMLRVALLLRLRQSRYKPTPTLALLRRCECGQLTKLDPCQHCGAPSLVVA